MTEFEHSPTRFNFEPFCFVASDTTEVISQDFDQVSRDSILRTLRKFDPLSHLDYFERRFPEAMRALEAGGVHPTKSDNILNPYTGSFQKGTFKNVGEHCLAVGFGALAIAEHLHSLSILDSGQVDQIVERAIVHDAQKAFERMRAQAAKDGNFAAAEYYDLSAYQALADLLKKQGVSPAMAEYITHAGKETGHTSFIQFIKPLENGKFSLAPNSLSDRIVHFVDDITFTERRDEGSPIVGFIHPVERMIASEFKRAYPWMWKEGLALNANGEIVVVRDISNLEDRFKKIGSYAYLQPRISRMIAQDLRTLIVPGLRPGIINDEQLLIELVYNRAAE